MNFASLTPGQLCQESNIMTLSIKNLTSLALWRAPSFMRSGALLAFGNLQPSTFNSGGKLVRYE